jgi:hypothetical protein
VIEFGVFTKGRPGGARAFVIKFAWRKKEYAKKEYYPTLSG